MGENMDEYLFEDIDTQVDDNTAINRNVKTPIKKTTDPKNKKTDANKDGRTNAKIHKNTFVKKEQKIDAKIDKDKNTDMFVEKTHAKKNIDFVDKQSTDGYEDDQNMNDVDDIFDMVKKM